MPEQSVSLRTLLESAAAEDTERLRAIVLDLVWASVQAAREAGDGPRRASEMTGRARRGRPQGPHSCAVLDGRSSHSCREGDGSRLDWSGLDSRSDSGAHPHGCPELRPSQSYRPEVIDSKLLSRSGDVFEIYLRMRKKKIITVVLDTEHHVELCGTRRCLLVLPVLDDEHLGG